MYISYPRLRCWTTLSTSYKLLDLDVYRSSLRLLSKPMLIRPSMLPSTAKQDRETTKFKFQQQRRVSIELLPSTLYAGFAVRSPRAQKNVEPEYPGKIGLYVQLGEVIVQRKCVGKRDPSHTSTMLMHFCYDCAERHL